MSPCQDLFQGLQELSAALNQNLEHPFFLSLVSSGSYPRCLRNTWGGTLDAAESHSLNLHTPWGIWGSLHAQGDCNGNADSS